MPYKITSQDIGRQLKADLIGKDSYRGVTLTYAWMANQFGHFGLGFIPTILLYRFLANGLNNIDAFRCALYVSLFWLLFEMYNFLGPLLKRKHSRSKLVYVPGKAYTFEPAWKNIAFDTSTDLLFFWTGAFTASLVCDYKFATLLIVLALVLLLVYPVHYWFRVKIYLQTAQYPLQFRLSQWEYPIDEVEKNTVLDFLQMKDSGKHLLIFGAKGNGKTSLAVAIATELSIRYHACTYTSGIKLCSMFFEPINTKKVFWDWRSADVLVIDDINPGDPIKEDLVKPEAFLNYLDQLSNNTSNREVFRKTSVVWVLGNDRFKEQTAERWHAMIEQIGVKKENIFSINLF